MSNSSTDPLAIQSCGVGNGTSGTTVGAGYTVCSGTAGAQSGTVPPVIPNCEPLEAQAYLAFYNSLQNMPGNACITQGVPNPDSSKTNPAWNTVGYVTGSGCCSTKQAWTTGAASGVVAAPIGNNDSKATRLTPFSTAGKVGAYSDAGLRKGLPADLTALTKVWGFSQTSWMHGGVHADNVGVWAKDVHGKPFTIKLPGQKPYTQDTMLWVRMTGDNYDPTKDPYGSIYPAPNGSYISACAGLTYTNQKGCNGTCDVNPATGLVLAPGPKTPATGSAGTVCIPSNGSSPYTQVCNQYPLTSDIMANPGGPSATSEQCYSRVAGFAKCAKGDGLALEQCVLDNVFDASTVPSTGPAGVATSYATTVQPWAPFAINGYSNPKGRVGGCFATRDMYGPGKFSVMVNLPPTAPVPGRPGAAANAVAGYPMVHPYTGQYPVTAADGGVPGGRGYVFSMWSFAYTEAYAAKTGLISPFSATDGLDKRTNQPLMNPVTVELASGSGMSNGSVVRPAVPGIIQGSDDDGWFVVHNHEIDIEIPANSAQAQGPKMTDTLGLDTANFNTWLSDADNYAADSPALYQQVQARAPKGQFFASVGPDDDNSTFHEFSFVWYVDPKEEFDYNAANGAVGSVKDTTCNSYVAFYRDGEEIFKCHRFVPRRSGRVLIGLWPAWWGSNYAPLAFNHVYASIARLEFVPQCDINNVPFPGGALVTNGTQMYDTNFPVPGASDGLKHSGSAPSVTGISCGFETEVKKRLPCSVTGACGAVSSTALPIWAIVVIIIGAALVVAGVSLACIYGRKRTPPSTLPPAGGVFASSFRRPYFLH